MVNHPFTKDDFEIVGQWTDVRAQFFFSKPNAAELLLASLTINYQTTHHNCHFLNLFL